MHSNHKIGQLKRWLMVNNQIKMYFGHPRTVILFGMEYRKYAIKRIIYSKTPSRLFTKKSVSIDIKKNILIIKKYILCLTQNVIQKMFFFFLNINIGLYNYISREVA